MGGVSGLMMSAETKAQEKAAQAVRGLPSPKIKDISVIATQPGGVRLIVVKVTTDQDGLVGYGCATFTQRADLVGPGMSPRSGTCATCTWTWPARISVSRKAV